MSSHSRARAMRAFTLIEMVVVILVVIVLFALLAPAILAVRDQALAATCLGNMRQYGTAMLTLAADQGGLPLSGAGGGEPLRVANWLKPYLEVFPKCPLSRRSERKVGKDGLPEYGFNYVGNGNLSDNFKVGDGYKSFRLLKDIPAPSSRVVLAAECYRSDGYWAAGHLNRTIWGNDNGSANPEDEGSMRRPQYHGTSENRGLHFFFLDGHAKLVTATENDWTKKPTKGDKTNGGYFYEVNQIGAMARGNLTVP